METTMTTNTSHNYCTRCGIEINHVGLFCQACADNQPTRPPTMNWLRMAANSLRTINQLYQLDARVKAKKRREG
jgi:ribosomal protein L37E